MRVQGLLAMTAATPSSPPRLAFLARSPVSMPGPLLLRSGVSLSRCAEFNVNGRSELQPRETKLEGTTR
jgi:hypothetical protein